jgi:hypothetical protein
LIDGPDDAPGLDDELAEQLQYPHVSCEIERAIAAEDPQWFVRHKHQLNDHWHAAMVILGVEPPTPSWPSAGRRLRRRDDGEVTDPAPE